MLEYFLFFRQASRIRTQLLFTSQIGLFKEKAVWIEWRVQGVMGSGRKKVVFLNGIFPILPMALKVVLYPDI